MLVFTTHHMPDKTLTLIINENIAVMGSTVDARVSSSCNKSYVNEPTVTEPVSAAGGLICGNLLDDSCLASSS